MMEKTKQEHHHQMMMIMKCPRCDSSNTKFCYYNNYSLSQPRHFCKACKRYWTRGGTLRNVPVGGGCRKNKKHHHQQQQPIKKTPRTTTTTTTTSSNVPVSVANPTSSTTVLYGLPTHRPDLGFGRGLGFSFHDHSDSILSNYNHNNNNNNILPCPNNNTGIQESYGFQRPYLVQGSINTMASKELEKPDDHDPNKLELWVEDDPNSYCQNQMVQINSSIHQQHDSSSLYWNPHATWLDPSALDFSS